MEGKNTALAIPGCKPIQDYLINKLKEAKDIEDLGYIAYLNKITGAGLEIGAIQVDYISRPFVLSCGIGVDRTIKHNARAIVVPSTYISVNCTDKDIFYDGHVFSYTSRDQTNYIDVLEEISKNLSILKDTKQIKVGPEFLVSAKKLRETGEADDLIKKLVTPEDDSELVKKTAKEQNLIIPQTFDPLRLPDIVPAV